MRDGLKAEVASALHVQGMALREGRQINRVDVAGVDPAFFQLADSPLPKPLAAGQVALNRKLADALGAKAGDAVGLRMFNPAFLSPEPPPPSPRANDTRPPPP